MTAMAATIGRFFAPILVLLLAASACSGNNDDIGTLPETPTTPSTVTTTSSSTTTTTEPTTTTLSEIEAAEAEIRAIVIEWYTFPVDTSRGDEVLRAEQTTGLLRQRILEAAGQLEADGQILRSVGDARIEIAAVSVDLDKGIAEVDACTGSGSELVDADTLEVISGGGPITTSTSIFQLQLESGVWKINEWLPSELNGGAVACEVSS
jgi:hypothetical protein